MFIVRVTRALHIGGKVAELVCEVECAPPKTKQERDELVASAVQSFVAAIRQHDTPATKH